MAWARGILRFGEADEFDGLLGGDGQGECFGIGQADVFAGEDDDAAGDEAEVFARMEHFREPVDGAFFVGRAHALDEGADGVVMGVAFSVVDDGFLLNRVFGDGKSEVDNGGGGVLIGVVVGIGDPGLGLCPLSGRGSISAGGSDPGYRRGRRREDADFQSIQAFAGVSVRELGEMRAGIGVHQHIVIAEAAFFVGEGAIDELFKLRDLERLELENLGAGDESAVDVEKRVVGRGADEPEVSALDVGQQDVLLRLIEMMDLVDEQDRFLARRCGDDSARRPRPCAFRRRCSRRR